MDAVIRPDQVQSRLKCSRSMVYKLIKENKIEAFKVGYAWRIYAQSLDEYIKTSHKSHRTHKYS